MTHFSHSSSGEITHTGEDFKNFKPEAHMFKRILGISLILSSFVFSAPINGVEDDYLDDASIAKAKLESGEELTAQDKNIIEELGLLETSIASAPSTFTIPRTTYLSESFETWPATGWVLDPASGSSGAWEQDAGDDYGPNSVVDGSYSVFFNDYDYSSGTSGSMTTPAVDLSSATAPRLAFYYYDSGGSDAVDVLVSTDNTTFTSVYTSPTAVTPWTQIIVDLTAYVGNATVYVKFTGTSVWGTSNPHVDLLTVEEAPTVPVLTVSADSLGFGIIPPDYVATIPLTISNGGTELVISNISTTSASFGVGTTSGTIATDGSMVVDVTFSYSNGRTDHLGELVITSNNPTSPDTVLLGGSTLDAPTAGGPDAFGYDWANSYDAGGPTYSWIDTAGATNSGIAGGDDYRGTIPVPFDFYFYGNWFSEITATTNGWMGMGPYTNYTSSFWTNEPITDASTPNNIIAPLWDDFKAGGTGSYSEGAILYKTVGTTPNRQFVVIFHNFHRSSSNTELYTFECILEETTNNIILQYKNVVGSSSSANNGVGATVGIEDADGLIGLEFEYNGVPQLVYDGEAIQFNAPAPQVPAIMFSEWIEGSSNSKALEIYNPTLDTVWLDNYGFPNVSNAPTTPGEYEYWNTFDSSSFIAPGDLFTVVHPSADSAMLAVADMTSFLYFSNGDDGFALAANGTWFDADSDNVIDAGEMTGYTVLDWIGTFDADPGSGWDVAGVAAATANHTMIRKATIVEGNTDWAASAGTDANNSEWVVFDQNTFRFLGTHPHTDYYEPNNDIANAYPIAIGDTLLSNLLVDPVNDVDYFSFAGNAGDMITIDMFIAGYSNLDGEVALLGVDSTQLITVDAGGSGSDEQIFNFTLPDTGTYYIVTGYYGDVARAEAGNYGLGISYEAYIPLQGEVCADPFLAVTGVNSAAQQPVWYEYTATIDGIITISSCIAGQSEDTRLYVYDGCDGTQVAYNDDIYCAEYSYASEVSFAGVAGTSYKLYWDDYWDNGPIDFTLTEEIATYPDLTITDVVWDPNAMTLSYNWNNVGDADAGFHYSSIWINNTNWPVHCGYPYGDIEYSITGLVAMTTEPVVVDLSDLTFGDYEIYVTVDNDCIVAESNEDNNETGPILFTIDPPATPSQLTATAGVEDIGLNWLAIPPAPARLAGPENAVFGEMSNRLLEGTSYAVETAPTRNKINPIQAEKELLELEMAPKLLEQYASRDGGPACDSALVAVAGTNQSNHTGGVEQWFSYTATLDGQITVSTCDLTTEDTYVIAYAACADWGPSYPYGTPIVTSDDFCSMQSEATISCIAGETYYFWWRSVYASGSTYDWTLTEAAGSPDLLASDFWYDPVDDALRIEVVNIGDLDAGGFYVDWYLTNPVPDSCGDYGGGYNAYTYSSSLTAGDTVIHSVTGAQAFMGYGSFTFGAYVDDDCMVDESVETNNSITGDFTFINPLEGVVWNIYRDGTYLDSTSTNPNYTDYAVMGGTEYCYYVTEMLPDTTESDTSNHACATPMIAGLCSVQDLAATDEVGAVTLTWSEPYMPLIADFIIDAIPYDDVNNNIGATDDFDVSGSDGADIAYSFTTVDSIALFITLCDSVTDYDTKIEVFAANGTSLAYNDDGPFGLCPEATLAPYTPSEIGSVAFGPGTYIIVVDGYSGEEGNYGLHVTEATTSRDVANIETLQYAREKALSIGYTMEQFLEMSRDVDPACGEHLGYSVQDAAGTELLFTVDEFATFDSLAPGEYCYQVVTVYDEGNAVASNVACATALAPPMPMITIVSPADSATVTYATVDIAFEVENFVTGGGARTTGAQPTGTENQLRTKGPHNGNILAKPAHADRDLVMLSQNDGLGVNGYFQSWGSGYGVVFDLTPYEGVTLEAIDFSHSSWGLTGNWPYAVHLVDMVSMTAISVVEGLTTTVNDDWELDVALGSVPAGISLVGVFVEPLGNAAEDAYPDVDFDVALDGDSRVVDLADYSTLQVAGGDFIIDLWINADPGEVDGHIAVTLNNEPYGEHFTSDPVTISGLVAGENTIKLELVDNDGNPLDPSADDSITLFYVNTPPNAFNLLAPIHEDTLYLTPDNVGMNTLFAWMPSTDPEGAQVWYHVAGTLVELAEPYELDTTGTAVFVSNTDLFNDIDGGGLAGVTIEWNVTASDGIDETASGNGPFTVYIDISALLGVGDEALIPDVFALHQNYPNPFNPTTRIEYDIPEISNVQITVYNVMGQKVRTLVNTEHSPGYHSVLWNGTNEFGSPVSSGMYFYQIKANNFNKVKKLVLMK